MVGKAEKEGMLKQAREVKEMAAGGKYRTQALALLVSLPPAAAGGAVSEEAALTAALSALSLSAATAAAAAAAAARGEGEGKGKKAQQQQKKGKKKQSPQQQPGKTKTTAGKGTSSSGLGSGMVPASRTLLERLGELDGGKEASGFGIAHVPPTVMPVRAKPQLFDMAFNFLEGRLPDLAAKAGLPPSKKKAGAAGGGEEDCSDGCEGRGRMVGEDG